MDSEVYPIVGPAVDYTKKLAGLSNRIQRIEVMINILEAKIASIPGLEDVTVTGPSPAQQVSTSQSTASPPEHATDTGPQQPSDQTAGPPSPEAEPEVPKMTVAKDPRYAKYFQMVKVGVPAAALRGKMLAEGLDPDLLDTPDAAAPGGTAASSKEDSDEETSSASSFSDDD